MITELVKVMSIVMEAVLLGPNLVFLTLYDAIPVTCLI